MLKPMALEIPLGQQGQATLFGPGNGCLRKAESIAGSGSDLNEDKGPSIFGDQVDLSQHTADVLLQQLQPLLLQERRSEVFPSLPFIHAPSHHGRIIPLRAARRL